MQIQSQALLDALIPGTYELRSETRHLLNSAIDYAEAVSLAVRGQIEGIATPAGRIKYLRMLSEAERPKLAPTEELADESSSTAFAHLNMGAFREPVISVGEVIGYIYQLHRQPATGRHAQ